MKWVVYGTNRVRRSTVLAVGVVFDSRTSAHLCGPFKASQHFTQYGLGVRCGVAADFRDGHIFAASLVQNGESIGVTLG